MNLTSKDMDIEEVFLTNMGIDNNSEIGTLRLCIVGISGKQLITSIVVNKKEFYKLFHTIERLKLSKVELQKQEINEQLIWDKYNESIEEIINESIKESK